MAQLEWLGSRGGGSSNDAAALEAQQQWRCSCIGCAAEQQWRCSSSGGTAVLTAQLQWPRSIRGDAAAVELQQQWRSSGVALISSGIAAAWRCTSGDALVTAGGRVEALPGHQL